MMKKLVLENGSDPKAEIKLRMEALRIMRLWYFMFQGASVPYGPIKAESEKEARCQIRRVWEIKTTRWVQVWETTQASIDQIARQNQATAREMQAAGHAICSTDL